MGISDLESRYRIRFPERHLLALRDPNDPIHAWCDFFIPATPYLVIDFALQNDALHDPHSAGAWPDFFVAFASNGCGDYWAYDTRRQPPTVVCVAAGRPVGEHLSCEDLNGYGSFEAWYAHYVQLRSEGVDPKLWRRDRDA